MTLFVTDMAHMPAIRAVRDRYIPGTKPAASAVQVAALFNPDVLLEIEAFAIV
jgi:enamine deaminase RidA (YjgF/YER057c/UK114 family)